MIPGPDFGSRTLGTEMTGPDITVGVDTGLVNAASPSATGLGVVSPSATDPSPVSASAASIETTCVETTATVAGSAVVSSSTAVDAVTSGSTSTLGSEMVVRSAIHFDIFTLFPSMFSGPFAESIIKRAQEKGLASIALHNIRSYTTDKHSVCDDTPYGGGGGMLMKPEPIFRSVETVLSKPAGWSLDSAWNLEQSAQNQESPVALPKWSPETGPSLDGDRPPVILLTPQGRPFNQALAQELSQHSRLMFVCGRYEGVDERVRSQLISHEISIGDFVLSGGELAAMVVVDAIIRLIPGVLGYELSAHKDSHSPGREGLLEGPQYTRPLSFRGETVPDVLLSGHHKNVDRWHREQSLLRTLHRRPELLANADLTKADLALLKEHGWEAPLG